MRYSIAQLSLKIRSALRQLNLKVTRLPGAIVFNHGLAHDKVHGYIYVNTHVVGQRALKIGFICENASGVRKNLPYVQEEIVQQARMAGFDPIYLNCLGPKGEQRERSVDSDFALIATA